ncbi:MAG: hypothetical protein L6Q71_00605 [Planctomycetes bacterium]|nr:hypothetical protein [Planctomycetota bacterium]NUQ35648.1 hypothetical protein [Planctomycetaceae bacterium]
MVKTLKKHGNSLALVLDKAILELLNIERDTPLKVTTDGERLVIERARHTSLPVVLEHKKAVYWATTPALPGAVGQGGSERKALEDLHSAVVDLIESYARDGEQAPWVENIRGFTAMRSGQMRYITISEDTFDKADSMIVKYAMKGKDRAMSARDFFKKLGND